jgi:hypothetical protein
MGDTARPRGRGPAYTRRVMPTVTPQIRSELRASGTLSDWKLRHGYTQVAFNVVVPLPADGHDPDSFGGFGNDVMVRAVAHHLLRPDAVLGGWGAAAAHGLRPDWADHAPVVLLTGNKHRRSTVTADAARSPMYPVIRPLPENLDVTCPVPGYPRLKVVTPPVAAAHCLWTVLTGRHEWWVHDVPDLTRREVRAVQFIDAFAQCTWITREQIREASAGLVNRNTLARVLDLADDGAQSPMETVMRLMVRDLLPAPYSWTSQTRVDLEPGAPGDWPRHTLPDLGCRDLKIALYYDGAHHQAARQTDVDFDQFLALRDMGWEVLRFTKEHLRSPGKLRELVRNAIVRALAAVRPGVLESRPSQTS